MDAAAIDQISLNFNQSGLLALNAVIGLMMYGVALDMKLDDFKRVIRSPKGPAIGLGAQFILLPAFTFLLTFILPVTPSMALGMMLVAACPGGNLSNVMTYLAQGNTALSVSMTAVSTAAAVLMTPLNLAIWGSLNPATNEILRRVSLNPMDVFMTIVVILGIPLILGIATSRAYPRFVEKIRKPFKVISVVIFCLFVAVALGANWQNFLRAIGLVAFGVFVHNALALTLGYTSARLFKLPEADRRAVSIEVGIQNSALALILIFTFFEGLGGMAIIAGWWGIWHIISGLTVSFFWSYRPLCQQNEGGRKMENSNGPMMGIGIVGFLIGGFVAFLARPSVFLIGKLPFEHVISRGANFKGMDQMLVPIAQQSFDTMLIGSIIGAIAGIVIGYFVGKKKVSQAGS